MDIAAILTAKFPDALWGESNNDYATLVWDESNADPKPTKAKLEKMWPQVQYENELAAVKAARHARYVAETDPLFYKAQRDEDGVTLDDWKAAVAQIKAELPKPTPPEA